MVLKKGKFVHVTGNDPVFSDLNGRGIKWLELKRCNWLEIRPTELDGN